MEQSILKSTKKILGVDPAYDPFDLDIITHINAAFSTLEQLGIGSPLGFAIEDDSAVWNDLIPAGPQQSLIRSYVALKVRLLFDPPTTSYLIEAATRQVTEMEWRLSTRREGLEWVDPVPEVVTDE